MTLTADQEPPHLPQHFKIKQLTLRLICFVPLLFWVRKHNADDDKE